MRRSAHRPEQRLGSALIPQCRAEPAGVVIPPGSPRSRWLCSILVPGKGHCPGPAELQQGQPGGNPHRDGPNPLRSQREAKGSPKATRGHRIAHSVCSSPAGALWTGLAVCKHRGQSPSQSHPAPRNEGKDCLAQHPAVPPCQHHGMGSTSPVDRMGPLKHDLAGTGVLTVGTRVPLWGHGCERTPKQTHLYEYCIVYIIFFLPK